jgi:hypothetical protein
MSIGPLRLLGLDGFERQVDGSQRMHLRNSSEVEVIISVFSIGLQLDRMLRCRVPAPVSLAPKRRGAIARLHLLWKSA